jgi:hypothetical protein
MKRTIVAALHEGIPGALLNRGELHPRVEETVSEQSRGATIRGFAAGVEGGERVHIPELAISGHGET